MSKAQIKKAKSDAVSEVEQLKQELATAQETVRRAQADYQNLVRRSQTERAALIDMAAKDVISSLLPALRNLELAASQLDDAGLNMVVQQLQQALGEFGLTKIEALNQPFDVTTMEAVDRSDKQVDLDQAVVTAVRQPGYRLNDHVIQHAKVVVGNNRKRK